MQHYNPSIGEDLHRIFNLKGQAPTNEVSDEVVPVIIIERNHNIVRSQTFTNATAATIYTTPTDKDFYLEALTLSVIKDATSQSTLTDIRAVIDGVSQLIARISGITLTAQNQTITLSGLKIKVDRGTNITLNATSGVANIKCDGSIIGYTVETLKGV